MQFTGVLHRLYFGTFFEFDPPPGGLPENWAMVSAFARTGSFRTFEREREHAGELHSELELKGVRNWSVLGRSASGDHAEPRWGVDLSVPAAREIGARYDQHAIFWVLDGTLWVGECDGGPSGVRVGPFAPRVGRPITGVGGDSEFLKYAGEDAVCRAALLRFLGMPEDRSVRFRELLNEADSSAYSAEDWCRTAARFQNRLEILGRRSGFQKKIGYLHCCADAVGSAPSALIPSLAEAFEDFFGRYGFDG